MVINSLLYIIETTNYCAMHSDTTREEGKKQQLKTAIILISSFFFLSEQLLLGFIVKITTFWEGKGEKQENGGKLK